MAEKRNESTHPEAGDLKERLTAEQYQITQEQGTEPAFANRYWDFEGRGVYHCVVCGNELFSSSSKYHSGTGWPSFYAPTREDAVVLTEDRSLGMTRTEVTCGRCGSHLGHVFPDGPRPSGQRYCMNSAALSFVEEQT